MKKHRFTWSMSMMAVAALVLVACSDVDEGGGTTGGGTDGGTTAAAQCGSDTLTLAVNPWVGAEANAAVAQAVMQNEMGCTVELQEINESGQFPAMADGDVDATLEVWPSGHLKDRKDYIEKAGTVVDAGELGIVGNIGWFVPSYVVEENPDLATWEGFKDNADAFATAETGDKGQFLGADPTTRSSTRRSSRPRPRPRGRLRGSEAASLDGARQAIRQPGAVPVVLVDPAVGQSKYDLIEVELPETTCARDAAEDPDAARTTATTPRTCCTRRRAPSSRSRAPAAFEFLER